MDSRSALAAKTCAPWRSACSFSTPATEVCDDRSCHNRSAGGVALPQPSQHLYDVSREVVLPLLDWIVRADHGSTGTRQSISWNTRSELPPEDKHGRRHGITKAARSLRRRMVVGNRGRGVARR